MGHVKKGKNFSTNNLGQRKKSDFYETPYSMTEQLLMARSWHPVKSILEPSCGSGAIVKVLESRSWFSAFPRVDAFDLQTGQDFLTFEPKEQYDLVITNPPFSLAHEFILKAKQVSNHTMCMLLPLSYLHGKRRYDTIYQDVNFPLAEVWVFTRYPMLGDKLREDGKYRTGMMVYAWFVWDKQHHGHPTINWLDNNGYVLGKADKLAKEEA